MREEALSYWLRNRQWALNRLEIAPLSTRTKNWILRRGDCAKFMEHLRIHLSGELRGIWRSCLNLNVRMGEFEVSFDVGTVDLAFKLVLWKLG
ncbi:hypothetical protein NpPPO83_00005324 [Neofusicoccum parvum]|uniref:Uncharacterized protein n=1 Tax=Neofusicoccum parvum TaxID=310453 RepID=A0ACB5S610_9PEZI|nr:hypothetical protein NpPPO83_00005324 [Neofusicoccum parvum]